jgi:glycosyltransferase involved in cell wall biosynthesis
MRLGIDASNIRAGGGLSHLKELLSTVDIEKYNIEKVVVWSCKNTLNELEEKSWLKKCTEDVMEKNYLHRAIWQNNKLNTKLIKEKCDILFVPGGSFTTNFSPVITMNQNLLPFALKTIFSYGISFLTIKFILLRCIQAFSFKKANGIIFLTEYAKGRVLKVTGKLKGITKVIPHGIDENFFSNIRPQLKKNEFSNATPFKLIYVSNIEPYKHQNQVIESVALLRSEGYHVSLKLIGSSNSSVLLQRFKKKVGFIDPDGEFIKYTGMMSHKQLQSEYKKANIFVFASSCEAMPITLMEGMASGVPIACSNRGPMSEIIGDACVYFDPENVDSIVCAIRSLIESPELRVKKAKEALNKAKHYTWERCAEDTFSFFLDIVEDYANITYEQKNFGSKSPIS